MRYNVRFRARTCGIKHPCHDAAVVTHHRRYPPSLLASVLPPSFYAVVALRRRTHTPGKHPSFRGSRHGDRALHDLPRRPRLRDDDRHRLLRRGRRFQRRPTPPRLRQIFE